jgi:hypothetical protein
MLSYKIIILFILVLIIIFILNEIYNLKNKINNLEKLNTKVKTLDKFSNENFNEFYQNEDNLQSLEKTEIFDLINNFKGDIFNKSLINTDSEHLEIYSNSNDLNNNIFIKSSINSNSEKKSEKNSEKNSEKKSEKNSEKNLIKEITSESIISNSILDKKEELSKLKLIDIKKIAEDNNICLTKKVGKTTKYKIKEELINEINNL